MRTFNPFNVVRADAPQHNSFDLSFDNKLSLDMAELIPVLTQETLPGDKFRITPEMLIRFAPMTFPIMQRIDSYIHFFYVPKRIVWEKFPNFLMGEQAYVPYITTEVGDPAEDQLKVVNGSLLDYFGLPTCDSMYDKIEALPMLAYLRIYNEYYQDQNNDSNYTNMRDLLKLWSQSADGRMDYSTYWGNMFQAASNINDCFVPLTRSYEHDYFTSALPFAQKGNSVNIPLTLGALDVEITNAKKLDGTDLPAKDLLGADGTNSGLLYQEGTPDVAAKLIGTTDGAGALEGTINQLRAAMQLQKFLETNARGGTRYNELIKAHFNVNIGDDRINRPEYIGCIKNNVVISEVLQTSQTSGDSALGDYAGHATAVVGGNSVSYYCPEHGYIIGILSVMPRTAYFQGIPRKFQRFNYLDYYWKEFAHIGEQEIKNKELYYNPEDTQEVNDATFGYLPRYSDLKYNPSEIHGDFRGNMLDWHLGRFFITRPSLNEEFIYAQVDDTTRIFAVTTGAPHLYAHVYFNINAQRKIPFFTDPAGL